MKIERRTLVRTTAWATPVIATMAPVPVFAASGCAPVPYPTGWYPSWTGILDNNSGMLGVHDYVAPGFPQFVVSRDNANTSLETSSAATAVVHMQIALHLVAGRQYTFSVDVASRFLNDRPADGQNMFLLVQTIDDDGTVTDRLRLVKGSNPNTYVGGLASWRQLSTVTPGPQVERFTFTFTPRFEWSSLRYRFLLPARGKVGGGTYSGNNDIAISAPTITGC